MLTVRVFRNACTSVTDHYVEAAAKGIRAEDDDCEWTKDLDEPCDIAFHTSGPKPSLAGTSLNKTRLALIERFGWKRLVLESPCFRQGLASPGGADSTYWRLSLGGFLDDEAIYHPPGFVADSKRWDIIQEDRDIKVKGWRTTGNHVVICGQKPQDSSLRGLDTHVWMRETVKELRLHTDRKIVIRLHPKDREGFAQLDDLESSTVSISDPGITRRISINQDLKDAWAMVTYTSLSAIDAICEGIPVFAMDSGNFAWKYVQHDLSEIEAATGFERKPWLWDLAYRQWTSKEFITGKPWRRLREAYLEKNDNGH